MRIARFALMLLVLASPARGDFGFVFENRWGASGGGIRTLVFAPDGSWVLSATERSGNIFDLNGEKSQLRGTLQGPRKEVLGAAVSPDGKTIALVDAAGLLYLYDAASLTSVASGIKAHSGRASSVSFTSDGNYLLTGGEDGKVKIWTPRGGFFAELSRGPGHKKEVLFVAGVPPGRNVVSVGRDRRVILWQVDTQQAVRPIEVDMDVRSAAFGGSGLLVLGLQNLQGNLHWSRVQGGMGGGPISTAPTRASEIQAKDHVRLVDVGNGTQLRELEGLDQDLDIVGATPDGRFVAAGGEASISIWDTATGQRITSIPADAPLTAVAFSPDGKRMALGASDGSLSLYRLSGVGPIVVPVTPSKVIIVILEPSGLAEEGASPRGEVMQVRSTSLRLRGQIKSAASIKSVLVDGHEITSLQPDGAGNFLFNAYVPVTEPGRRRFEVIAETNDGSVSRQSFVVERAPDARPVAPMGQGQRRALIVGISRYEDKSINLAYASDDARALYQTLTNRALGPAAFDADDVELLLDEEATAAAITTGLRDFLQKARENDFVLFFFAGHGAPDPNRLQDLYLLAHDTDPRNIAGTGLLMRHVREAIAEIPARDVLILSDACHGAGIANTSGSRAGTEANPIHQVFLDKLLHASGGLAILTASEAAQLSYENEKWGKHGVFTYYLLKGLRGEGDADHDGIVSLGELMEYVRDQVRTATGSKQIPAIGPTSFDRQMPLVIVTPRSP